MARESIPLVDGAGTETTLGMLPTSGGGMVAKVVRGGCPRRALLDLDLDLRELDERRD